MLSTASKVFHPQLAEFVDKVAELVDHLGRLPANPHEALIKREELDVHAQQLRQQYARVLDFDCTRTRDRAQWYARDRGALVRSVVQQTLRPRPAERIQLTSLTRRAQAPVDAAPLNDASARLVSSSCCVHHNALGNGFIADMAVADFPHHANSAHVSFEVRAQRWRVELTQHPDALGDAGFWLTLLGGKPRQARFTFSIIGPQRRAYAHCDEPRCWEVGKMGWGFEWDKLGVPPRELEAADTPWLQADGRLHCRVELIDA
ncbi:MAG: hypothetical protein EOO40_04440 [Deltaproteobacteria bacterium]|nr:MAG: hypothetical protein EOO40_04440 [Deltaproteobacteria bacterium]